HAEHDDRKTGRPEASRRAVHRRPVHGPPVDRGPETVCLGMRGQFTATLICRGLASSRTGSVMLSTPSLKSARTFSVSIREGSENDRLKVPYVRSMRWYCSSFTSVSRF